MWIQLGSLTDPVTRLRRALTGLEVGGMCLLPGGWGCGDFMARQYISFVTRLYSFWDLDRGLGPWDVYGTIYAKYPYI